MIKRLFFYLFLLVPILSCRFQNEKNQAISNTGISLVDKPIDIKSEFPPESDFKIVGLLYHRFGENRYPSTSISPELFEEHLRYIVNKKIPAGTLSDCLTAAFKDSIPDRTIAITIDDAFVSFYRNGYPLLKKYGIKATLFINTETVGSGDYMSWDQLQEVSSSGIEIGNHTHSHEYFLNVHDSMRMKSFKVDVALAQKLIRENLHLEPLVFAYPFGEYDSAMVKFIKESGFLAAAAQNSGVISKHSNPFRLPRFPMTDLYGTLDRFIEKTGMNPLPVKNIQPDITIPESNSPELSLILDKNTLDFNRLQCFIQGSDCIILQADKVTGVIKIKAGSLLQDRRHLYTVTIPDSVSGKWHWFSHQWVFPNRKDE